MLMKFLKFYDKFIFAINEHLVIGLCLVMGITMNLGKKPFFNHFFAKLNDTNRVST
jgi:hypothetical protein